MSICRRLIPLLSLLAMAAAVPAQDPETPRGDDPSGDQPEEDELRSKLRQVELDEKEAAEREEAGKDGEKGGANSGPSAGLERHVGTVVALKPSRIAPGAAGMLNVVLVLQEGAALRPGAQLEIQYPGRTGPLTLGAWTMDPAQPTTRESFFHGQPVYDNTAIVQIPVQVDSGADYGTYPVGVNITADVADESSGASRGVFFGSARGSVTVGDPIPTPMVRMDLGDGDSVPETGTVPGAGPSSGTRPAGETPPAAGDGSDPAPTGRVERPLPGEARAENASGDSGTVLPSESEAPSIPWLWIVGGLAIVGLGAAGLAAARKS